MESIVNEAVGLLRQLIAIPSVSRNEQQVADLMEQVLSNKGLSPQRVANNVWAVAPNFRDDRPTVLLNAHLDTVKPVSTWTRDPHDPAIEGDRLYGLGSNDCGGGLVSLLAAFCLLSNHESNPAALQQADPGNQQANPAARPQADHGNHQADQRPNLVFLASAEEEISGPDGIVRALPLLPPIDVAIVGEPTGLQPAVAEKGLMVLDLIAHGKSGHAARDEGVNAIYEALDDLAWIRSYRFERVSPFLGATKMQATVIHAGTQHNVVPDECRMLIDVRTNECYTNQEAFAIIDRHTRGELHAHSFRLSSSHISTDHPLIKRCVAMGMTPFGSPTLSDQALMPFPSFKLGPGQSSRSHSADEYICISEIRQAIDTYCQLLATTF